MAAEQAVCLAALYAAYFAGLFLPRWAGISVAVVAGVAALVGYLVCAAKKRREGLFLFPVLFSVGAGFAIAAYFCEEGCNFWQNGWVMLSVLGAVALNCLLLFADWGKGRGFIVQNILSSLLTAGAAAACIVCFCRWNAPEGALLFREAAFVWLYLCIVLLGEMYYIWFGGNFRHAMNLSFSAAFFVVFFVVLLIVTEGDAGDVLADAAAGSVGNGGKVKKHR